MTNPRANLKRNPKQRATELLIAAMAQAILEGERRSTVDADTIRHMRDQGAEICKRAGFAGWPDWAEMNPPT